MKFQKALRIIILVAIFVILPLSWVVGIIAGWNWGTAFFVLVLGSFVLEGLREIPNQPPHKAVVTIFGKRQQRILQDESKETVVADEGWNFFPLFPLWYGHVLVEVKRVPTEAPVEARTPDRAKSQIPIAITFRPITKLLVEYLNNGGQESIAKQLLGKIQERVREWAISGEAGPANWRELMGSQLEAVSILTKMIGANGITEIPPYAQDIPTIIWMRWFTKPLPELNENTPENEKKWMENNWAKVEAILAKLDDSEKADLKEAVRKRKEEVTALRAGSGNIIIQDLGIVIERLNVGDIQPLGRVAEAADAEAKEKQEREGEKIELTNVQERIKELMLPPFNLGVEQSLEIVQTERGKVKKEISESKLNISPETRTLVKEIIPLLTSVLSGKGVTP